MPSAFLRIRIPRFSITLKHVYDELKRIESNMITKEELQRLIDTVEIMGNNDTMQQLTQSAEDIREGRVKDVNSVKNLLSEM